MADEKKATGAKLAVRGGGFALMLPVIFILGVLLAGLVFLTGAVIVGVVFEIGSTAAVAGEFLPALLAILALGLATLLGMIFTTARYVGGLGQLWGRLRGIRQERQRVEQLVDSHRLADAEPDIDYHVPSESTEGQALS